MNTKTTTVEMLVAYISFGWGIVLITNNKAFSQSNNFEVLQSLVKHEWILGVVCLTLSLLKITGMILNNRRVRWIGLILSALMWIAISATFLMSTNGININTGFITYSGIAVMALFSSKEVLLHDRADKRSISRKNQHSQK